MLHIASDPLTGLLVAALALARVLDLLSTRAVTPRLALEANPLMRRLGWGPMALLNLALLGLPFLHHGLSVAFVVTSLLAAGNNLAGAPLARGMGEAAQLEAQRRALRRIGLAGALALNTAGALVTAGAGGFLLLLSPAGSLAWWGALGVVMYGVTGLVHYNAALLRLGRGPRS